MDKIKTVEDMYQEYLVTSNLKEENMHPNEKIERKRSFIAGVGVALSELYTLPDILPDEYTAAKQLQLWHDQVLNYFKTQL